jgi:drug/metabolite transporter (DMT)-like permease
MKKDRDTALRSPSVAGTRAAELVLMAVTFVWGSTFIVTRVMLRDTGPFAILSLRFLVAAAALLLVFGRRLRGLTRAEAVTGAVVGVVTFGSYALVTAGLEHIASSRSAFVTSMYVPLVPLLQLVLLRKAPRLSAWLGIGLSFAGLVALSGPGVGVELGVGDRLTLGGAVLASMQIVLLSRWVAAADPMRLAMVQVGTVALLSLAAMSLAGEAVPSPTTRVLAPGIALGLLSTAFVMAAMSWAQQTVSATRATVIYSMEPVWGGVIGALAGEAMTRGTLAGFALIIAGVLVSSVRPGSRRRRAWTTGSDAASAHRHATGLCVADV